MKYIVKSTGLFLISTLLILAGCDSSTDDADMAIEIDSDDIAGVVTSASGPEAGVWVIAETDNLDTRYIKTVVTDDDGNYLLPDLPSANYSIWVRGYGLVDSAKVEASPGVHLDLTAIVAPDAASAAEVYPHDQAGCGAAKGRTLQISI
jgi:hypothetical protein